QRNEDSDIRTRVAVISFLPHRSSKFSELRPKPARHWSTRTMARHLYRVIPITFFVIAVMFVGRFGAHSDASEQGKNRPIFDASYRSRSTNHKVIVQANEPELRDSILAEGGSIIEDYGAFVLMTAHGDPADRVSSQSSAGSSVRDDLNVLLLRSGAFDTTEGETVSAASLGNSDAAEAQLYLVQFVGPIKKEWFEELNASVDIISYVPNNAYLIRANSAELSQIS